MSDTREHTTTTVYAFLNVIIPYLQTQFPEMKRIHYFTDGCAGQYKNKSNFINLCHHEEDFGLEGEWNFFTSHGKSACDGIGGTVKRLLTKASSQRPYTNPILTTEAIMEFCTANIPGIHFVNVPPEEIAKHRAADNGRTPDIIRPSVLFIRGKKFWSVTMSGQDQGVTFSSSSATGTSNSSSEDYPPTKKRALAVRTFEKWIRENDKLFNTRTWLVYEKVDREFVSSMKCKVCVQFKDKLASCRNFSAAFIEGSRNLRASAFKDHARSDMHRRAMLLFRKQSCTSVVEYAPIAKALCTLDASTEKRLRRKFEIAYFLCKENMPFTKMEVICQLEESHGVDLGLGYKNRQACSVFVEYIAKEQRQNLADTLGKCKFFAVQTDGSTDSANLEEELILAFYFNPTSENGKVCVCGKLLSVRQPARANADGLYKCLMRGLARVNVEDWESKLVGFGCDGASVNLAGNGLRGRLEEVCPWVVCVWCMAHRLQLAIQDALKKTSFANIDDILLHLYYLYEKSPKKCRELEEIASSLKECLERSEWFSGRGLRPVRASGTRFVSHKVAALNRFTNRFGAYLCHMISLTEDPAVKAVDKQKLKGYIKKWRDGKVLVGCAFFHDLLKPCSVLSKVLQDEELNIIDSIEAIMKTNKAIERIKTLNLEDLPTVSQVMSRVQGHEEVIYQGCELVNYEVGVEYFRSHKGQLVDAILVCLKQRLSYSLRF